MDPATLPHDVLVRIVADVQHILYGDGPDSDWSPDILDELAALLERHGLVPAEPPAE